MEIQSTDISEQIKNLRELARSALNRHNPEEALRIHKIISELDPEDPNSWIDLGDSLIQIDQLEQAEKAFQRILYLGEQHNDSNRISLAYRKLASVYERRGDAERTRQTYLKILKIYELKHTLNWSEAVDLMVAYNGLAGIYDEQGNVEQSQQMTLKYKELRNQTNLVVKSYKVIPCLYKTRNELSQENLIVKDFGPLRNVALELKQIIIFIGPQSSGKSTIAKLVEIFRNPQFLVSLKKEEGTTMKTGNTLKFFEDHKLSSFFGPQTEIEYISDEYSFSYSNGELKMFLLRETLDNPNLQKICGGNMEFIIKPPIYIPSERSFVSMASAAPWSLWNNDFPIAKNILSFAAVFEQARSKLQHIQIDFLNVVYKYENNQDKVLLDSEKSIKLTESASGLQTAIPLIAVIEANYDGVPRTFVIEEPELNLFPVTQRDLVYYLIAKATFTHENQEVNELVITTHSPYILAAINLCLFAQRVAQKRPDKIEEIQVIVPQFSWLNPNQFCAYYVGEGTAKTIFNPKTGMISESILDEASEMIGSDFDELMEIYRKNPDETTS